MSAARARGVTDLDRLAAAYGIEGSYTDAWGKRRQVSRATKCSLLRSMGVPAESEAAIDEALAAAARRSWRRPLPPALVIAAEARRPSVPLAAPCDAGQLAWSLTLEEGGSAEGSAQFPALALLEQGEAGGLACERRALPLPRGLPLGYHELAIELNGKETRSRLIVAPPRCRDLGELLAGGRGWGIAAQLYSLRGKDDWGLGDFGLLADFARRAGEAGADAVGLSPLHALFPADPGHEGPYAPSSRVFLNVLYIDVAAVEDLALSARARERLESAAFLAERRTAAAGELVDYPAVSRLKLPLLREIYADFVKHHLGSAPTARGEAFRRYLSETPLLKELATFEALHEQQFGSDPDLWDWRRWPEALRHPQAPGVAAFARTNGERIGFFAWLQWIAEAQLEAAQQAAKTAGMALGLYRDLAVAAHPGGAMAWSEPEVFVRGAAVGAPPDAFNPNGQNWGLAAPAPSALLEHAFAPFVSVLRSNMRHAGALRIDHVMALARLYWIPEGASASEGAYVTYPAEDLLRIVALESQRSGAAVIGEDLGTLPKGFRERLRASGILSYRLLWFEREEDGSFRHPGDYSAESLVAASTHDLPTVSGWWHGRDLDWRERLGLLGEQSPEAARAERDRARALLLGLLIEEGLLAEKEAPEPSNVAVAIHRLLAGSPAKLMMVQAEDLLGVEEQANLPGTFREHPNWRRRLPETLPRLFEDPLVRAILTAIRAVRGRAPS